MVARRGQGLRPRTSRYSSKVRSLLLFFPSKAQERGANPLEGSAQITRRTSPRRHSAGHKPSPRTPSPASPPRRTARPTPPGAASPALPHRAQRNLGGASP